VVKVKAQAGLNCEISELHESCAYTALLIDVLARVELEQGAAGAVSCRDQAAGTSFPWPDPGTRICRIGNPKSKLFMQAGFACNCVPTLKSVAPLTIERSILAPQLAGFAFADGCGSVGKGSPLR